METALLLYAHALPQRCRMQPAAMRAGTPVSMRLPRPRYARTRGHPAADAPRRKPRTRRSACAGLRHCLMPGLKYDAGPRHTRNGTGGFFCDTAVRAGSPQLTRAVTSDI